MRWFLFFAPCVSRIQSKAKLLASCDSDGLNRCKDIVEHVENEQLSIRRSLPLLFREYAFGGIRELDGINVDAGLAYVDNKIGENYEASCVLPDRSFDEVSGESLQGIIIFIKMLLNKEALRETSLRVSGKPSPIAALSLCGDV